MEKDYHVRAHGFLQSRDYEPLSSILDGLRHDTKTRLWIEPLEAQEDYCDTEVDSRQIGTGVEILCKMSHNP
jgi:hypothetical protein